MNHPFAPNNFSARTTGSRLTAIDIENGQLTRSDKRQRIEIMPVKLIVICGEIKFMCGITCRLALRKGVSLIFKTFESFVHGSAPSLS
jgi:hypothetical protein